MIDASKATISFNYDSPEINEIARNLNTLYGTIAGTVPMDRNFGLNNDFVDYPPDVAKNMIALEMTEKTELYEPRVEVNEVTFTSTIDGTIIPNIILKKAELSDEGGSE